MISRRLIRLGLLMGYPCFMLVAGVHDCIRLMLSVVCLLPHVMLWGRSHYTHFWFAHSTIQSVHAKWQQVWLGSSEMGRGFDINKSSGNNAEQKSMQTSRGVADSRVGAPASAAQFSQLPTLTIAEPPLDKSTTSSKLHKQQLLYRLGEPQADGRGLSSNKREQQKGILASGGAGEPLRGIPKTPTTVRDDNGKGADIVPDKATYSSLDNSANQIVTITGVPVSPHLPIPRTRQSSSVKKAKPIAWYDNQGGEASGGDSEETIARYRGDYRWRFGNVSVEEVKSEKSLLSERKERMQKGKEANLEDYESHRIRSDIVDTQVKGLVKNPGKEGRRENTGTQERVRGDTEHGDRRVTPINGWVIQG
jgi:hypothetical protein